MELLGIESPEQLASINIGDAFYMNKADRETINNEVEKNGFVKDYELNLKTLNNVVITVRETSTAIKDKSGKNYSISWNFKRHHRSKKNEDKLKQLVERLEYVNNTTSAIRRRT